MASPEQEFRDLLREIQEGSQEAARNLLNKYGDHILRVIRRRLDPRLRSRFDSCDFLQDVMASFFHNPPPPEVFAGSKALCHFLAVLARNKVLVAMRGQIGSKRDVNVEKSLEGSARVQAKKLVGTEPSPSALAVADEQWQGILQRTSSSYGRAMEMLRQGNSHEDVARELNVSVKTVQRLIQKLRPRYAP